MRRSSSEPAQVVLDRLRSSEPQPPTFVDPHNKQPHRDRTFKARHAAWQAAVEREEARLKAEQDGTLEAHLDNIKVQADGALALRLEEEKAARGQAKLEAGKARLKRTMEEIKKKLPRRKR